MVAMLSANPVFSYDSWHEQRFGNLPAQVLDMSCGPAALAGLISNYSGIAITEAEILLMLSGAVDKNKHKQTLENGFSLLDLKKVMFPLGLTLNASRISEEQLIKFDRPAILQFKTNFGHHFVLWNGYYKGWHWLSDPARGQMWLSSDAFSEEWSGVAGWVFHSDGGLPALVDKEKLARGFFLR